jgi:hypothetical protein
MKGDFMMLSWHLRRRLSTQPIIGLLLCSAPAFLAAQQGPSGSMSQMNHAAPESMIDGAQHPELVDDATAYRLVFAVLSLPANPSADEQAAQMLRLRDTGLSDSDVNAALVVLNSFKAHYTDLIDTFNNSARVAIANGGTPDLQSFDVNRDALVQATRDELKRMVSPEGMAAFHSFVQREKKNMKVPASSQ